MKNREIIKKICHIFHHNFKNIPCYVMSEVSLKRFYFALFEDGHYLKNFEIAVYRFLNSNSSFVCLFIGGILFEITVLNT